MNHTKDFSENVLSNRFSSTERQLSEWANSLETKPDEFESLCQGKLEAFLEDVQPEVDGELESKEYRCDVIRNQLKEADAHQNQLIGNLRLCQRYSRSKGRAHWFYLIMYLALIAAAMAIFVCNIQLIFPEGEWWIGALSSLIVIGPSFLVSTEYIRRHDRDRFLRWIHWLGLFASILMVVAFAFARAFAYLLLNSASSGSFLSGSTSSSALDKAQMIASLIAFLSVVATEIAFGGRLAISIAEHRAAKQPIDDLKKELMSVKEEINQSQEERSLLERQIAHLQGFSAMASAWKQAKLEQLILLFKETQSQIQKRLLQRLGGLSASELDRLLAINNNGHENL